MAFDEALADRVRDLLAGQPVEEKKMFGGLCFLVGGHLAVGVLKKDLVVKVPAEEHDKFAARSGARPFDFTGKPMAGILYVDGAVLDSDAALRKWVEVGVETARAKPAKTAKRK
jgi:TfoX/Sxy family transcriptional regulator of competence genes